jgi:hypothetical protein
MTSLVVSIAGDARRYVESKARRSGVSETKVVRRALEAYRLLHEVRERDGEVVLRRADGNLERLVRI